jgi:hypothetical protein
MNSVYHQNWRFCECGWRLPFEFHPIYDQTQGSGAIFSLFTIFKNNLDKFWGFYTGTIGPTPGLMDQPLFR